MYPHLLCPLIYLVACLFEQDPLWLCRLCSCGATIATIATVVVRLTLLVAQFLRFMISAVATCRKSAIFGAVEQNLTTSCKQFLGNRGIKSIIRGKMANF